MYINFLTSSSFVEFPSSSRDLFLCVNILIIIGGGREIKMGGRINGFDWVKGKIVGSGSFGSVHLAMNRSTGGLFVAKTAHSDAGHEALQNEVNILNTLKNSSSSSSQSPSPYIIQCLGTEYDHQDNNNKLHVFMEYMAGGSLADALHKFGGSFDEHVVRLYTRQILLGLYHLHQQGIVHCDLKCKNVLLSSSGTVKLADFGCAKRIGKDSHTNKSPSSGGTPLWMAPEVLLLRNGKEERVVDFAAADIWSLGCTVIEMATGRPPWVHDDLVSISNPMSAMFKIACGDGIPQFPSHFSQEGFDFLRRCLVRDPNKRSTAKDLLNHPFLVANTLTYHKPYCNASPAAVLDVHQFEDDYDDDGEEKLPSPAGRNKFSFGNEFVSPQVKTIWQQEDSASGNHWITIRSW
ncbi:mitogen-activated protein kinase kinase kinase 17 [Lathyrus oleraceus]|uniref:Protein kinase domain-containing protein n=1 Tax=Pisum sativum TaxID=3888 RepID=A0A9D5BS29_PEA|nr:mitogen-activated protein kinase kinase kinase 17-like [Pisum sativum]KAI5448715.1 hypothetical protein KIW84_015924 [Pisum sativum]